MFWGYIDDSGDETTGLRTLSCFIGHWSVLFDFEVAWNRVIEKTNLRLAAAGRWTISRFHATDWSTKRKEFTGWSDDEKFELFDNLLALFKRYNVVGCGEGVYLQDVAAVFPEAAAQDKVDHLAHTLLFSMIVLYIDQNLLSRFPTYATDRIAFVHDSELFNGDVHAGVATALGLSRSQEVQCIAALTLAIAGDVARAQSLAHDLGNRFPEDTIVQSNYLPTLYAQTAVSSKDPSKAIENLKAAAPYELGYVGWLSLYPVYVRGQSYLATLKGSEALAEFQKILDHRGVVQNDIIDALAHLQLGRAYATQGDTAKAKEAYQDFLTLWKDADPDIPIFIAAKAEYAKLRLVR